ncbi:MAG: 2-vinyl bacteriochlorophyllide hydratase [Chlorobium sp.]|jgi:3-vinyl bacteriochlorophyllide hydratase|uniref:2-vinyl bacteriochlorophyllide hydratase n=1 Tax=Chlorobium sp. TaxID=1095 RepID=UPI0025BA6E3A|nr:2-vinyl bacteriochlorophyllide hydratase [Chlorobium sp.]MCF8216605.1 2-vinyl bacteriochlorophyllide hydratase [Chlorobium sp.]MCF8271475.1 2-vinyl bacteriochlorophyllide hydratase [Chlorobium sp.]MCF8287847.1 2-vinyl bacteriochlorophyllide hydratase [Chlorobium sp.]MCF8291369.1 2-vinyl bacteriochlorophyllide hydratase [Chlorobium sp.]MCF8385516.1 2-vinyl bacteriochlorophyllide hydratase [Chlorobium sp.]
MPRYTPEQLARRNASPWTKSQAILAPIQFLIFLAGLTVTWLYKQQIWIDDFGWITFFVTLKTLMLFLIFVTGAFFEKEVFGAYAFAPEFFWEDFGSAIAMIVHISYFVLFFLGLDENLLIWTALLAYLSYLVNATQFVIRLLLEKHNEKKLKQQQPA